MQPEPPTFLSLIQRVRTGEEAAATELVRRYEPAIRRAIRLQLRNPNLRRLLDSVDICQSVLASFFVRAASGQYELDKPEQLVQLLTAMARNKLASQARKSQVTRREELPPDTGPDAAPLLVAPGPTPSQVVASRELVRELRERLSADEQLLMERRLDGKPWEAIAQELGGTADALRKKYTRAIDRAARELGLDEPD